jgi:nicotinic acid mononucleotide adenylyltransferase
MVRLWTTGGTFDPVAYHPILAAERQAKDAAYAAALAALPDGATNEQIEEHWRQVHERLGDDGNAR